MNTEKIDEIMDCSEFAEVLSDFSSLAIEKLAEETEEMSQKIRDLNKHTEWKAMIVNELDKRINELRPLVQKLVEKSESIDIDLIRAKQKEKKMKKAITKLKSLNNSNIRLEARYNDKMRLSKTETTLLLTSSLLNVFVSDDKHAIIKNSRDHQLKAVELNNNNSNEVNRAILWKAIGQSQYSNEWQQLL